MSKHRPQRIVLINRRVPKVVIYSSVTVISVSLRQVGPRVNKSENPSNNMRRFNTYKAHIHFFSFLFAGVNTDKWVAVSSEGKKKEKTLGCLSGNKFDASLETATVVCLA